MPWLRLWIDVLDDVDLYELSDSTFRGWVLMLAAAKKYDKDGTLPELKTLAHWMHTSKERVQSWINELVTAGFLDRNVSNAVTISVHGWYKWQEPTDRTNAIRQARFRAKKKLKISQEEQNATSKKSASRVPAPDPAPACAPAPPEYPDSETDSETDTPPTPPTLRNRYVPLRNAVTMPPESEQGRGSECVCVQVDSASPQEEKSKIQDDPEVMRIANLAAELTGDISWSLWVSQRVTLGDPVSWVESAIREMVDTGIIQRKYVGGILRRYALDGGPKHCCSSNGKPKAKDGPTNMPYSAINLPPDLAQYDTPEYRETLAKYEAQQLEKEKTRRERAAQRRKGES